MKLAKEKSRKILILLLGFVISLTGAYGVIQNALFGYVPIMNFLMLEMILIVGGLCISVYCCNNIRWATGLTMLVIGVADTLSDVLIVNYSPEADVLNWALGMIDLFASILLIYFALSIWAGVSNGTIKGILAIGIMLFISVFPILYYMRDGASLIAALKTYVDNISMIVMYSMVLVILMNKEMRMPSITNRIIRNTVSLTRSLGNEGDWYISRAEMKIIESNDMKYWTRVDDGPIEYQRTMMLYGRNSAEVHLQRWKGDNRIHFSIRPKSADSAMFTFSMAIETIIQERDTEGNTMKARMYGRDGVFIDIVVLDPDELDVGYLGRSKRRKKRSNLAKYTRSIGDQIDDLKDDIEDEFLE